MNAGESQTRQDIQTHEDPTLVAVHHEAPSDRWVVLCHGLLSNKSGSYEGRARRAVEAGYNAVRFDFRGCGDADGKFVDSTLSARIEDLQRVVDYFDPDAYALFGSSFGGKVALHVAAADDRVDRVATRAPVTYGRAFADYRETVDREGVVTLPGERTIDDAFLTDFESYDFETVANRLDIPVAIVHGGADETVPIEDSFEAAQALDSDVLLEKFAGEGHRFSEGAERRLRERVFEWLHAAVDE